jgi:hypothetical protein
MYEQSITSSIVIALMQFYRSQFPSKHARVRQYASSPHSSRLSPVYSARGLQHEKRAKLQLHQFFAAHAILAPYTRLEPTRYFATLHVLSDQVVATSTVPDASLRRSCAVTYAVPDFSSQHWFANLLHIHVHIHIHTRI